MTQIDALRRIIEKVGTQAGLAERLAEITGHPYKQGHVSYWLKNSTVPAEIVLPLEQISEGEITRYQIRPDVFGESPEAA